MGNTSKIIDRIQKLLALSTSSNPNESASAAAKAAQLMSEYELEEADLRVESNEANPDPIDNTLFGSINSQRIFNWQNALLQGLIKAFHCHGWYTYLVEGVYPNRVNMQRFQIIGRRANVQTCNYMYQYLEKELRNLANQAWLAIPASEARMIHGKRWKNSFLTGAVNVIYYRLIEQVQESNKPQANESKAMILVRQDKKEVDLYYAKNKPASLRNRHQSNSTVNLAAYSQGKEAGSKVNLGGSKPSLGTAPLQITA